MTRVQPPPAIRDPKVQDAFDQAEPPVRDRLMELRALIYQVAAGIPEVGPLTETLKWGEPSYLTEESGSGTTIRINRDKKREGGLGLYVNCQTSLLGEFRALYGDQLAFDGNRAILLDCRDRLAEEELRHCIALALTYHRRRKTGG